MMMLWALQQSGQVAAAKSAATGANYKAREVGQYAEYLEQRIDKLTLICRAMWSFLQEATDVTEEQLAERVNEIDLSDGQLDGRVGKTSVQCKNCGKMISPRHRRCIWCGAERPADTTFDSV